ncbi:MAG TPA: hypothetical protein VMJ64_11000 [Anaerolineales bacterium]|nr:hypothetical protein [Anaerolineales bacterium]
MKLTLSASLVMAGLLLSGCIGMAMSEAQPASKQGNGSGSVQAELSTATSESSTHTPTPGIAAATMSPDAGGLIDLARQDLAARLGVDLSEIHLLNTIEITWPDLHAGCGSAPGQILTKGRVYGYRVWLEANGAQYLYHVGKAGEVLRCEEQAPGANNPLLVTPGSPTQDPHNSEP